MKQHFSLALSAVTAICALLLCSCAATDPKFVMNAPKIPDVNYPPDTILGTWADMFISPIQGPSTVSEGKIYYEIRPNGKGGVRQFTKNARTGHSISLEADIKWKYFGNNKWEIYLPPSSEYRVTSEDGMEMGKRGAVTIYASFYDDELYVLPTRHVWVRADAERVADLSRRLRNTRPLVEVVIE